MLPEEVMLLDFTAELPLAFPVEEVAPSTEEAEPALASQHNGNRECQNHS
jgi:hypothetical protein